MKYLTFHGPTHLFTVTGLFTLARGETKKVEAKLADQLIRDNPRVKLTAKAVPVRNAPATPVSQPEAQKGEGQPPANDSQKE